MAQLIYFAMTSLDGYIEDEDGKFDWAAPSDEVHAAANDLVRAAGILLYGRRMYETMAVWETDPSITSQPGVEADFAADLADSRQDRVLEHPVGRVDEKNHDRTQLRYRHRSRVEGVSRA